VHLGVAHILHEEQRWKPLVGRCSLSGGRFGTLVHSSQFMRQYEQLKNYRRLDKQTDGQAKDESEECVMERCLDNWLVLGSGRGYEGWLGWCGVCRGLP